MKIHKIKKLVHSFSGLWDNYREHVYHELNEFTDDISVGNYIDFREYDFSLDGFTGRSIICEVCEVERLGTMVKFGVRIAARVNEQKLVGVL